MPLRIAQGAPTGGGTAADAARRPDELADAYPEPSMFGVTPAWGLWVRHAHGLRVSGLHLTTLTPDARPPLRVEDASDMTVDGAMLSV